MGIFENIWEDNRPISPCLKELRGNISQSIPGGTQSSPLYSWLYGNSRESWQILLARPTPMVAVGVLEVRSPRCRPRCPDRIEEMQGSSCHQSLMQVGSLCNKIWGTFGIVGIRHPFGTLPKNPPKNPPEKFLFVEPIRLTACKSANSCKAAPYSALFGDPSLRCL